MPSQFDDAEEEVAAVRAVPVAKPLLAREASKYGGLQPAAAGPAVATKGGGLFPAYGQDRYTPVLPTEMAEDQFGGLDDVYELSGDYVPPHRDTRFHDAEDEEEEDDETDDGDDGDDDLLWFDGHEGVSGDFTKTFKAEIAGNRPNSAATQANVLMARAKRQAGEGDGKLDKQEILRKFQPSSVRNAKAERRICTQSLNEKRLQQLSDSMHKGVFGGAGGDKAARARGAKDKADRATTEQVLDPRTRLVLYKLLNKETLNSIHGCVSTGKEANVYYATTPTSFLDANNVTGSRTSDGLEGELAIKVYKTSILVFKDRDKCVSSISPTWV